MLKEREIRELIIKEATEKGWKLEYLTAERGEYSFIKCQDDYECLKNCMGDFIPMCDRDNSSEEDYTCETCWMKFMGV